MSAKFNILAATLALCSLSASAKYKAQTVYMYGFAASFKDSTVYFTDIQQIDSAYIDSKTTFLYGRANYSEQLSNYLESNGLDHPTCITSFGKDLKEAKKKYLKLRGKYLKDNKYNIKYIKETDFKYTVQKPDEQEGQ
ncbi:MAG: hypothetical protein ACOYJF_00400 [Prevotella sp.]|jgi:hypothetical protein